MLQSHLSTLLSAGARVLWLKCFGLTSFPADSQTVEKVPHLLAIIAAYLHLDYQLEENRYPGA